MTLNRSGIKETVCQATFVFPHGKFPKSRLSQLFPLFFLTDWKQTNSFQIRKQRRTKNGKEDGMEEEVEGFNGK